MKPRVIILISLLLLHITSYSQELKHLIITNPATKQVIEDFYILNDNPSLKQGPYISYYNIPKETFHKDKNYWLKVIGFYHNGKKDSIWMYYNDPNMKKGQCSPTIKKIENYKDGIPIKIWTTRNESDKTVLERFDYTNNCKLDPIIEQSLNYPDDARELGKEGLVQVKIYYTPDCLVNNIETISNPDSSLTASFIKHIIDSVNLMHKYGLKKDCSGKIQSASVKFVLK